MNSHTGGGKHFSEEEHESSPIALCLSVSRWGVPPFCRQNASSPVAPCAGPCGEGHAAQKDIVVLTESSAHLCSLHFFC